MMAFVHHLTYDFRTGIRDRSRLLMLYLFPLVFFAIAGGLMVSINPGFPQMMVPAMAMFAFLCAALLTFPGSLVSAREAGIFRSYRVNGVPSASILSIPVIGTAVHMAVVTVIVWAAAVRVFGGASPVNAVAFAIAALLSYAAYAGIGVLIGVAAGSSTVSTLVGQLIYIPSIILGGLMVPSSALPPGLQRVALLFPSTHGMRLFMSLSMGGAAHPFPLLSLCVLLTGTLVSFLLAGLLFQWDAEPGRPAGVAYLALIAAAPFAAAAAIGGLHY